MADAKQTAPKAKPDPTADLRPAAEATDPQVHQLLAERELLGQEDTRAQSDIEAAQKSIDERKARHEEINQRLAELGYR